MALLSQMTLNYLENLLLTNPGVQNFTGLGFSDYPNPTRAQVKNAWQSLVDQLKYNQSVQQLLVASDPSTAVLGQNPQYPVTQGSISAPSDQAPTLTDPKQLPIVTIGLNTGANMNAYLENVLLPSQVQ
jgi:hypothetical protein